MKHDPEANYPVTAHPLSRYTCEECNWEQIILTPAAPTVMKCAWCGWPEPVVNRAGAFATLTCATHGLVTCVFPEENIAADDFGNLTCPHCERQP